MLILNQKQISEKLAKFVWDFKVGDNIAHNFKTLYFLYKKKEESLDDQKYLLNKPIIITIVSIIEGVFYDLVCRLDMATNHFPESIGQEKREKIKRKIEREKEWFTRKDFLTNKDEKYKRIKNYKISELIRIFSEYELLGEKDNIIYKHLEGASYLRNRIHIFNWFGNFEIDEDKVFNESRLGKIETLLIEILNIMEEKYDRPFQSGQDDVWYSKMIF
jgi:hypothetical protein